MDPAALADPARLNVRHSLRSLARTPAFTAAVVLTLALGIGTNSAVFSAINAVLLRPLPFPHADRLMQLAQVHATTTQPFLAPARLQDWQRLNSTFEAISGYFVEEVSELSGEVPEKLTRATVAPRFLQVWGIAPAVGCDFTEEEYRLGGPRAVLVSDGLWLRRFNRDRGAVGKTLRLGQSLVTIVGVLPRTFLFTIRDTDVWAPAPMDAPYAQGRNLTWFSGIGRLRDGVTVEQARANLASTQAALGREYPATDRKSTRLNSSHP
jgi:putative ABC transport system permease protein